MDGDGSAPSAAGRFSQTMTQSSGVEYFELLLVHSFVKTVRKNSEGRRKRGKKSFTIRGFLFSFGLESN